MNIKDTKALITDVERRKALPIIRALGEKGVKIIGLSYYTMPLGAFSKYCSKVYRTCDYLLNPAQYLKELENILSIEKPDTFFPIEDDVISLILLHRSKFEKYTKFVLPEYESFNNAYDKWHSIRAAQSEGIPVPITYLPVKTEDVNEIMKKAPDKKYVIKPRKSSGSRGISFVDNAAELEKKYLEVRALYGVPLIQEMIPREGRGYGVSVLFDRDMELRALFGHRRIREYPLSGGPSTLRASYFEKDLMDKSVNLARKMNLVGVSMIEYKENATTGEKVFMEINPRFWGSLQLAIFSGVNFPLLYHLVALGEKPEPVLNYETELLCRWLLPGDILNFLKNKDRLKLEPSFFDFFNKKQSYDIISSRDPFPMVGIVLEGLRKIFYGNK